MCNVVRVSSSNGGQTKKGGSKMAWQGQIIDRMTSKKKTFTKTYETYEEALQAAETLATRKGFKSDRFTLKMKEIIKKEVAK
jgi:hypothetical protein